MEDRPGFIAFRLDGPREFSQEAGGHRWQRVPPTEKRGRTQTSTVTVAVLPETTERQCPIAEKDLRWKTCRGSGAGGQHRNTTDSAVQLLHEPSGIQVRCEGERSQAHNKTMALAYLRARLHAHAREDGHRTLNNQRRAQVGTGMRGDKIRTVAIQRDSVTDHRSGARVAAKRFLRGDIETLWTK